MTQQEKHNKIDRLMKRAYRLAGLVQHGGDRMTVGQTFRVGMKIVSLGVQAENLAANPTTE